MDTLDVKYLQVPIFRENIQFQGTLDNHDPQTKTRQIFSD